MQSIPILIKLRNSNYQFLFARPKENPENWEASQSVDDKTFIEVAKAAALMSDSERKEMADKELEMGHKCGDHDLFNDALKHYTRSIYLHPSASAYNDRAITYFIQSRFKEAHEDLNVVLNMEPDNVSALLRRALTFQHQNELQEALDDLLYVLRLRPHLQAVRNLAYEFERGLYQSSLSLQPRSL